MLIGSGIVAGRQEVIGYAQQHFRGRFSEKNNEIARHHASLGGELDAIANLRALRGVNREDMRRVS
jgi:hypothetical protein